MQGPSAAVPAFVALCIALCACNATGPLTAAVVVSLPREAQPGGLALWNSVASVGGYMGPAIYGWLKGASGSNAPGMVVRPTLSQCNSPTRQQHRPCMSLEEAPHAPYAISRLALSRLAQRHPLLLALGSVSGACALNAQQALTHQHQTKGM